MSDTKQTIRADIEFRLMMAGIDEPPVEAINSMELLLQDYAQQRERDGKIEILEHLMTSNPQYTYAAAKDILIDLQTSPKTLKEGE